MPVAQNFSAWRTATWAPTLTYTYSGDPLPLTGAHFAMQLRLYAGAPDPALLALNPIPFTDVAMPTIDDPLMRILTLSPSFTPTQFAGLPVPTEAADSLVVSHDIRITYADGVAEILSSGSFTVQPGVTTI